MRTLRARTTEFLINSGAVFVARLDNGGVRVGYVGGTCFDVSEAHPMHGALIVANPVEARAILEALVEAFE